MPQLGEFLGGVLGDLARARLQGDIETLRLADVYASHELLRHFPVPRFRLPELRLDVPAIIDGPAEAATKSRIDPDEAGPVVVRAIREKLRARKARLPARVESQLVRTVDRYLERQLRLDPQPPAATLAAQLLRALEGPATLQRDVVEPIRDELDQLRGELSRELAVLRAAGTGIEVVVDTGAVREVQDPDRLVRLHLTISEEAVEWTVIERAEGDEHRLVQE